VIYHAEIVPGIAPTWHIALTFPGQEQFAAKHLALRRVGLYLPIENRQTNKNAPIRQIPLFGNYLFVFLWSLAHHARLISTSPAILGFLRDGQGIPVTVPDAIIKQIEAIEWETYISQLPRSFFRKRRHQPEFAIQRWRSPNRGFASPIVDDRIASLHKALGLT
jgi:transcription antitermination factor NusG